jgi:hypothetical protein
VDPRDVENRLRNALQAEGADWGPRADPGQAWARIERRARREPWRRAGLAGLALAVVAALGFVVVPRLIPDGNGPAGTTTTPTPATTPSPATSPDPMESAFPAFYPVTTFGDAKRQQQSVDDGHQPLTLDPAEVARQFARDYIGWQRVQLGSVTKDGSAGSGWTAKVELRPYIGEADPPTHLGTRHVVELVGLRGAEEPTWFVTSIRSDNVALDFVKAEAGAVDVKGRGVGFEGTIHVTIKDDAGSVLHPRTGRNDEGFVTAGSTELGPFETTLALSEPKAQHGVLVLTGDSGLEGPSPDWTVVRLHFSPGP